MFDTHSSFMNGLLTFLIRFVVFLLALLMVAWGTWSLMGLAFADEYDFEMPDVDVHAPSWPVEELSNPDNWGNYDPPTTQPDSDMNIVIDPNGGETIIWKATDDVTIIRKGDQAITCYDIGGGFIKCQ